MKHSKTLLVMAFMIFIAGGVFSQGDHTQITTSEGAQGEPLKIVVEQGPRWTHAKKFFVFIEMELAPQMAVWAETMNGEFIGTLYVTEKAAKQKWAGNFGNSRPESLPVWSHHRGVQSEDGSYMPSKDDPIADALTAATPKGAFTIRTSVEAEEPFIIYAELNLSFDYNETYDKNSHKINGQPSLIYMGEIYPESAEAPLRLSLIGHGSPDGSDGEIHNGLSGITTARDIVESIEVYVGADE